MKVNNVPPSYNIGKLCVEDPISASRKFSLKFHAFFRKVLIKGEILGKVEHFYWKKEYQNRGAPHYHVLLWIHDAPVIDRDEPEDVLKWIQERIACHIPDKDGSPELYRLVTRYQLHNNNTQNAAVAPRPSTTHPLVWAEQHKHTSVYNLPVPGLPP